MVFESEKTNFALVAQSVERQTRNLQVAGSIPAQGSIFQDYLLLFCYYRRNANKARICFAEKQEEEKWDCFLVGQRSGFVLVGFCLRFQIGID